jgi:hypothetical protein
MVLGEEMNADIATYGRVYANDPDYDTLRGRVVAHHEVVGITLDGWKVRHEVTVIDFAKPEPVKLVDRDALIADEGTNPDGHARRDRGKRTQETLMLIRAMLTEKPLNTVEIAAALGETVNRIKNLLRNHPSGFVVVASGITGFVYGLENHTYPKPYYPPAMQRIVDYLKAHGPSTTPEICEALDIWKDTLWRTVRAYPGVIHVVGQQTRKSGKRAAHVWGLADGNH